jgi:hypothetical protein
MAGQLICYNLLKPVLKDYVLPNATGLGRAIAGRRWPVKVVDVNHYRQRGYLLKSRPARRKPLLSNDLKKIQNKLKIFFDNDDKYSILNNMKRKNKKQSDKILIRKEDLNPSYGHSQHDSGSGYHNDRPKRQRTRAAQNKQALKDYDVR